MIYYRCPSCGCDFSFRKRVTITKRYCPNCNRQITVSDVDSYLAREAEIKKREWREVTERIHSKNLLYRYISLAILVPTLLVMAVMQNMDALVIGGLITVGCVTIILGSLADAL